MTSVNLTQEQLENLLKGAVDAALAGTNERRSKVKHADRPEIDLGLNENQWEFFLDAST